MCRFLYFRYKHAEKHGLRIGYYTRSMWTTRGHLLTIISPSDIQNRQNDISNWIDSARRTSLCDMQFSISALQNQLKGIYVWSYLSKYWTYIHAQKDRLLSCFDNAGINYLDFSTKTLVEISKQDCDCQFNKNWVQSWHANVCSHIMRRRTW
jgi:hypothetical protein